MSIRALMRALSELAGKLGADSEAQVIVDGKPRGIASISQGENKARICLRTKKSPNEDPHSL
jgi:hypothetical protein